MRRVSSRQRLVSWDAFEATVRDCGSDEDTDPEVSEKAKGRGMVAMVTPESSPKRVTFVDPLPPADDDEVSPDAGQKEEETDDSFQEFVGEELTKPFKRKRSGLVRLKQEPPTSIFTGTLAAPALSTPALTTKTATSASATLIPLVEIARSIASSPTLILEDRAPPKNDDGYKYDWLSSCTSTTSTSSLAVLPLSPLEGLNSDVLFQLLSFLDLSSVRSFMQTSRRCRQLTLSAESTVALWTDLVLQTWPWLSASPCLSNTVSSSSSHPITFVNQLNVGNMHNNKPCGATLESSPLAPTHAASSLVNNFAWLLSLKSPFAAFAVDESIFSPCRWSHSLRRFRPRRVTLALELRTLRMTPTGPMAIQFVGRVGQGDRCIRANLPLPRPPLWSSTAAALATAASLPHQIRRSILCRLRPISLRYPMFNSGNSTRSLRRALASGGVAAVNGDDREQKQEQNQDHRLPLWRPFVVPFTDGTGRVHLTPRLVSYFEISIWEPPTTAAITSAPPRGNGHMALRPDMLDPAPAPMPAGRIRTPSDCVAVGLALECFDVHFRMPGWDSYSFGYHGDDGGIFHAAGSMVREYGPRFGPNDTVGCGMDYAQRAIFYTLNGRFLGYAFQNLSLHVLEQDWYPVVGVDTSCPVSCNFGSRPFLFDLAGMMAQQHQQVSQALFYDGMIHSIND